MSWIAIIMNPDNNKIKGDWFYLKQIALGIALGGQLLYILLEVGYKYSSNYYNISFSIFWPFLLGTPSYFILSPSSHLYPPHEY